MLRLAALLLLSTASVAPRAGAQTDAPLRLDRGRFTVVCYPADVRLARAALDYAVRTDTFPGLPRPRERVLLAIAPDRQRFREWAGPGAPEWGSALAFPESHRVILQGSAAGSDAGDPMEALRHELAHLALHEYLDDLPPRWFDEGYASFAAREWRRDDVLATNFALALRGMPSFDELEAEFSGPTSGVQAAYALAYQAVLDLENLAGPRGLALFLANWKRLGKLDPAMRATFGITLDDFEHRWQSETRRRYGGLALFGDLTLAGLVVLLVILPLYVVRRQRDRQRMAALREADAAAERAAARAREGTETLDALLGRWWEGNGEGEPEREGGSGTGSGGEAGRAGEPPEQGPEP